jgi:hypothetical protein
VSDLQIVVIIIACILALSGYLVLCDRVRR